MCNFFARRWTSRSLRRAWGTWWETSALGSTMERRALLMPFLPSEKKSSSFAYFIHELFFYQRLAGKRKVMSCFCKLKWFPCLQVRIAGWQNQGCSGEAHWCGSWHQALLSSCRGRLWAGPLLLKTSMLVLIEDRAIYASYWRNYMTQSNMLYFFWKEICQIYFRVKSCYLYTKKVQRRQLGLVSVVRLSCEAVDL